MSQLAASQAPPAAETPAARRRSLALVRLGIGVALIALLAWQAARADGFDRLYAGEKDYRLLAAALGILATAIVGTFVRWWMVAAAAGVPMTFVEALRYGAIGFAANFVALGNVGGDVVKATLVARGRPGRRARAVTTVLMDRVVGLLALLLFTSTAIVVTGAATNKGFPEAVRLLCRGTVTVTAVAVAAMVVTYSPGRPLRRLAMWVSSRKRAGAAKPKASGAVGELFDAYYRGRPWLAGALAVGLANDVLLVASFYLVAEALPMASPDFASHFFIAPLGLMAGAIPISPNGLGTTESAVEALYQALGVAAGDGALVAFGHRLLMFTVGAMAAVYYALSGQRARAAGAGVRK